jgi:hypothetical protein
LLSAEVDKQHRAAGLKALKLQLIDEKGSELKLNSSQYAKQAFFVLGCVNPERDEWLALQSSMRKLSTDEMKQRRDR